MVEGILFVDELYVKEDYRSRGVGAYFLSFIEKID